MALQREVAEAVAAAPDGTPRGVIVKQFMDRGASRATLYVWIERAMTGIAMNKIKGTHAPPIETDKRVIRGLSGKTSGPIDFQSILRELVNDTQMLRAMAKDGDGKIKNPRLLLEAVDKAGRTLDRAARIGVLIRGHEELDVFLEALMEAIKAEGPQVWGRISNRMREVNKAHGYFT